MSSTIPILVPPPSAQRRRSQTLSLRRSPSISSAPDQDPPSPLAFVDHSRRTPSHSSTLPPSPPSKAYIEYVCNNTTFASRPFRVRSFILSPIALRSRFVDQPYDEPTSNELKKREPGPSFRSSWSPISNKGSAFTEDFAIDSPTIGKLENERRKKRKKRLFIVGGGVVIALLLAAIGIIVGLVRSNQKGSISSSSSNNGPLTFNNSSTLTMPPRSINATGLLTIPNSSRSSSTLGFNSATQTLLLTTTITPATSIFSPPVTPQQVGKPFASPTTSFVTIISSISAVPSRAISSATPTQPPRATTSSSTPATITPPPSLTTICVINGFRVLGIEFGGTTSTLSARETVPADSICTVVNAFARR